MTWESVKNRASRYVIGAVIAGSLAIAAVPGLAFASANTVAGETVTGSTDTTKTYLQGDSATMSVSAPSEIHVMVKADGSFITPTAASTQIKNASIFGIHVSKLASATANSFTFAADASKATTDNAVQYSIQPGSGTAVQISDCTKGKALTTTDWNLTKTGTDGAALNLTTAGAINNVTKDLGSDQQFATLTWTFAPGSNKSA